MAKRDMLVGAFACFGSAWIDDDHPRAARLRRHHALMQHGVAPGGVRAREHEQIGAVEILVAAGHRIRAQRALVAGDGRGHAKARIGVDMRRADEALHQLVGDVIILGQQLPGQIEGDRVGSVRVKHAPQAVRDGVERDIPSNARALHHRMQQARFQRQRFAKRGTLGAKPAKIGGMIDIARDGRAAPPIGRRRDAATNAAIGAGCLDRSGGDAVHHAAIASARPKIRSSRIALMSILSRMSS